MNIQICFCVDDRYVNYLCVVINSLIKSNSKNKIDIYILANGVTQKSKQQIQSIVNKANYFRSIIVDIDDVFRNNLEAGGHISVATYIRFYIPEVLPSVEKILYLDADVIIADDLKMLWKEDIENFYIAAVENPLFNRFESLGMEREYGYFNAGVLLMNLNRWRAENIKEQAINFLKANKSEAIMFDQDALNAVIKGKWKRLDIRWNLQTIFLRRRKSIRGMKEKIRRACSNPGIIHYSTNSKPWDLLDPHPLRNFYMENQKNIERNKNVYSIKAYPKALAKWLYLKIVYAYQMI